ncbi:MAG: hypothetical protein ABFS22_00160 [Pseudomonadota bacterium]
MRKTAGGNGLFMAQERLIYRRDAEGAGKKDITAKAQRTQRKHLIIATKSTEEHGKINKNTNLTQEEFIIFFPCNSVFFRGKNVFCFLCVLCVFAVNLLYQYLITAHARTACPVHRG